MGVDTKIRLPEDVQVSDVTEAMGILAGLKPSQHAISDGAWYVSVDGAEAKCSNTPEMAIITLKGLMVDGQNEHMAFYHFECATPGRLVSVRSTPFWIAIGRRLVEFFGGWVDYSDCDEDRKDYSRKKPRKSNHAEDGKPWQDFQEAMFALKPITKADIDKCRQWAAYK